MGASCCIAARNKHPQNQTANNTTSLKFKCLSSWTSTNNEGYSAHDDPLQRNLDDSLGMADYIQAETGGCINGAYASYSDQSSHWNESCTTECVSGDVSGCRTMKADRAIEGHMQEKNLDALPPEPTSPYPHPSFPKCPSPSSSALLLPHNASSSSPSSSQKPKRRSLGYRIYRQISDSQIMKSLRERSQAETRNYFPLLKHNHDLPLGSSSDQWPVHLFSELSLSSQRERLSIDSVVSCSHPYATHTPPKLQKCASCSKYLTERAAWMDWNSGTTSNVPVIAVLSCGHSYHTECLENLTLDVDKYDPPCPACTTAGKQASLLPRKVGIVMRSKRSRAAVGDFDLDSSSSFEEQKFLENDGKITKTGLGLKSAFSRRFWRGRSAAGSRSLDCDGSGKKDVWT